MREQFSSLLLEWELEPRETSYLKWNLRNKFTFLMIFNELRCKSQQIKQNSGEMIKKNSNIGRLNESKI